MKLNSPNMMMKPILNNMQMTGSTWEDFRKRARQLENEIDAKLLNLNKLSVFAQDRNLRLGLDSSSDKTNLPSKAKIDELCAEIESLLTRLTDINDQMSKYFGAGGGSSSLSPGAETVAATNPALMHTMQRHRDILQDYVHEFQRSQTNIQQRLEREMLFSSSKMNNSNSILGGSKDLGSEPFNNHREDDPYMKEHDHVRSSDRLIDQQISIAISTKEHLQSQRSGLQEITKKIHHLAKRYPAISGIMQKINWRKRRDTIILGSVIAVCLFIMFIYATR